MKGLKLFAYRPAVFSSFVQYRRLATIVQNTEILYNNDIKSLIKKSFDKFKNNVKAGNPKKFNYDILKQKYDSEFLKVNVNSLLRKTLDVEAQVLKSSNEHIKTEDLKKNLPKILPSILVPKTSEIYMTAAYLLTSDLDINRIPLKIQNKNSLKSTEIIEFIMDTTIEKLMYMQFKPYYLQNVFNDKSNNQNYNQNLTINIMDVDNPCEWFPQARKIKRKFIMHVGPTNSGKTYNALKRLESCSKGYFAGPLRLLAREVYDKFQERGVRCNLVTGEEVVVDIDENGNRAGLTSGTIEMLSLSDTYDVIVVDEIQMIGDEFRGSAWTNAILGAKAKEIHLCGEKSAIPLIEKMVKMTGDDLEINEYNRLGKLVVDDIPVNIHDLKKGDCIVCFSKPIILDMKAHVEKQTGLKCAVIYGALPPETRAQEAQRFNNGEYDVVVASDAIGMGLNLKINRVIFTTTQKYNGKSNITLSDSNIKQIGGRAGRFGIGESEGHITAISKDELQIIKKAIDAPVTYLKKAALWPPDGMWVRYYSMFTEETDLNTMFRKFETDLSKHFRKTKHLERDFILQSLDDRKTVGKFFEKEGLIKKFYIQDQLKCIACPTTITGAPTRALKLVTDDLFKQFMQTIITRSRKSIFDFESMPFYVTTSDDVKDKPVLQNTKILTHGSDALEIEPVPSKLKKEIIDRIKKADVNEFQTLRTPVKKIVPVEERLMKLEQFHRATGTYMWLAYRFPQSFTDLQSATKLRELIEYRISEMLSNLRASNKLNKKRFKTF
ncbi:RNA helicase [Pichia californica]|uniref:ATP-dependent RNA helicase SUV3, mitochondrial n=1 Tax=Pichia californica TaxID=460514 RepID=A0A9P7BG96_9ASCO|nr:RNA helicase [[Candida] californica]KAG0688474.1 RNA helicase [[Candida] californica]